MRSVSCAADSSCAAVKDWGLIATTCEFLAFSFRYPNHESVLPVVSGEWAESLGELRHAWGFPVDAESDVLMRLGDDEDASSDAVLRTLRQEATKLFLGPPVPVASPYESVWVASRTRATPLLFVSPSAIAVERFCAACGLGRPEGTNESLDHISSELELLQFLASAESGAIDVAACGIDTADFPGGSPVAAFEIFFNEHVAKWVRDFAYKLEKTSSHVFYRAAARLLHDFVSTQ